MLHPSIFGGYQGVIKTCLTINERFSYQISFIIIEYISKDLTYASYTEMEDLSLDIYNKK